MVLGANQIVTVDYRPSFCQEVDDYEG